MMCCLQALQQLLPCGRADGRKLRITAAAVAGAAAADTAQ
jgi:hypothetical protein